MSRSDSLSLSAPAIPARLLRRQRGAVALGTGLLLLLLATIGTAYVVRSASVDQRVSANALRAKAAFEAADAGLNFAITFIEVDARDLDDDGTDDRTQMLTGLGIGDDMHDGTDREFDDCDTNGDLACTGSEMGTGNGYRLQAVLSSGTFSWSLPSSPGACDPTVTTGGVSENVRVCIEIRRIDDASKARVVATGYSDDRLGQAQISQDIRLIGPLPGYLGPTHPLVAFAGVSVSGSMQVVNAFSNATIWCGDEVTSFGSGPNSGTLIHPDPEGPKVATDSGDSVPFRDVNGNDALDSGEEIFDWTKPNPYSVSDLSQTSGILDSEVILGPDVIDNSADLRCDKTVDPDCFFRNFLVGSPEFVKAGADYVTTSDRLVDPDLVWDIPGSFIWVDARDSSGNLTDFGLKNGTYGSLSEPIVLVIDGNFDPQASPTIYGVVFVRGDVVGGGSGGGLVVGSMIVEGDNGFFNSGGLDIIYEPNIAGNAAGGAGRIISGPIPGTWRDWQ